MTQLSVSFMVSGVDRRRIAGDRGRYSGSFRFGDVFRPNDVCTATGDFFSRKALEAVGGWRKEVSYTADADFWFRIALRFLVRKLNRVMARYRYHPFQRDRQRASISRDWQRMIHDLIRNEPLDGRTRRYARSGIYLARHRYTDPRQWWTRTQALYGALVVNPAAVLHPGFPTKELVPGREPIWKQLSRAKQALGFRQRGT
jgi:hypothetical protein